MVTPKLNLNASVASKAENRYMFQDIWHIYAAGFAGSHLTVICSQSVKNNRDDIYVKHCDVT